MGISKQEHWDYDPNKAVRWVDGGGVLIEITLGQWDKRATFTVEIGGNTAGFNVLECAPEALLDQLVSKDPRNKDTEGCYEVTLADTDGNTLLCECWPDENPEDWVRRMVVRLEIVGWSGTKAED